MLFEQNLRKEEITDLLDIDKYSILDNIGIL